MNTLLSMHLANKACTWKTLQRNDLRDAASEGRKIAEREGHD